MHCEKKGGTAEFEAQSFWGFSGCRALGIGESQSEGADPAFMDTSADGGLDQHGAGPGPVHACVRLASRMEAIKKILHELVLSVLGRWGCHTGLGPCLRIMSSARTPTNARLPKHKQQVR